MPATGQRKAKSKPKSEKALSAMGSASGKTREAWLTEVATAMSTWFDDLGFPLPTFQISAGFPSAGRRGRDTAEAWKEEGSDAYTIFIRPDRHDSHKVAASLAHQLAHMAAGHRDAHGHLFRHVAISIGLRGRATEAAPGRIFKELVDPILKKVGPLPKPFLGPPERAQRAKQTTRLIKVQCRECGYVARVSRKWLDDVGEPLCPRHGKMSVEG